MPHRVMNEHKSRHRTHTVKPQNKVIGPLGQVVRALPPAALDQIAPIAAELPVTEPAIVETL